jgi:hypothetical protein
VSLSECGMLACHQPSGEPGLKCSAEGACSNPCPKGLAPDPTNTSFCSKLCKSDRECGVDKCSKGVYDRWEHRDGDDTEMCPLRGNEGIKFRCKPNGPCKRPCKRGHRLFGGTDCAKPCKQSSDCPGGECAQGACIPLCPSEGCPYRWD